MPQGVVDFTIVLPEWTGMGAFELKVYDGLDRLWRMVERYKMPPPIAIKVVDNKTRCVRALRYTRYQVASWQFGDERTAVAPPLGGAVEFLLTITCKMRRETV